MNDVVLWNILEFGNFPRGKPMQRVNKWGNVNISVTSVAASLNQIYGQFEGYFSSNLKN
jgi:hypothetical protein